MTFGEYPFLKSAGYSLCFHHRLHRADPCLHLDIRVVYLPCEQPHCANRIPFCASFRWWCRFRWSCSPWQRPPIRLHLDTPFTIPVIYLGFGAGLAVFMFVGFVKGIPLEIEEAAAIDGCSIRTFLPQSCSRCSNQSSSPSACWRSCGSGTTTCCPIQKRWIDAA